MHTPYDGSAPPFSIGLSKLGWHDWIELDDDLGRYLREKERLLDSVPDEVFVAEPGTAAAQAEVLALLVAHLLRRYPDQYRLTAAGVLIAATGSTHALGGEPHAALCTAARLVQEDLILMRAGPAGWSLCVGSLSFPSSWRLRDKFGKPLHEIHTPVPGFGSGTPYAAMLARMFDRLPPGQPMLRWNWGLYDSGALHYPAAANGMRRLPADGSTGGLYIRLERQTLTKLPASGHILFTIRTFLDPFDCLAVHGERRALATAMHQQIAALDAEQLRYKGLTEERGRLLARLEEFAA